MEDFDQLEVVKQQSVQRISVSGEFWIH